jgi:hypothetical protein
MKAKIFSFVKCPDTSIIASVRIARFVSDRLQLPIVTDQTIADEKLDVLVIINGAYAFCSFLEPLGGAIEQAKRVVWVQNDFTIIPPKEDSGAQSPFRRAFVLREERGQRRTDFWTTCEKWQSLTPGSHYVNWNCLTLDSASDKVIKHRRSKASAELLYYGSFRNNRAKDFDRFFNEPKTKTVISSPSGKFQATYKHRLIRHEDKITVDFYEYLGSHGLGLYLEDKQSHSEFHSPANRFYEMLSAGLPMVFQPECGTMMRRAGYDPSSYEVSKPLDVQRRMDLRDVIGKAQRDQWLPRARLEYADLPNRLHAAWAKLTDEL